jgi:hypothetical protein
MFNFELACWPKDVPCWANDVHLLMNGGYYTKFRGKVKENIRDCGKIIWG